MPNPVTNALRRYVPDKQFWYDTAANVGGLPDAALTLGTGLVDMAGTGLGAAYAAGRDWNASGKTEADRQRIVDTFTDTMESRLGQRTYQPKTEAAKNVQSGLGAVFEPIDRGMRKVGEVAADVTGSPAIGAGVYTALNVADPEMLAPAAAKVAALRGTQNLVRKAAETALPLGTRKPGGIVVPRGQRGAYSMEDLSSVEGDYSFKSPTLQAFDKLKPQERGRVSGKQLGKALMREGAKKDEIEWMGLNDILNSDDLISVDDVRKIAQSNEPEFDFSSLRRDESAELDDERISELAHERTLEDDNLEYPIAIYRGSGRNREFIEHVDNARAARERIKELKEEYVDDNLASETEYYLENIGDNFDEEQLAEMTDEQKQAWAEEAARNSLEENAGDNLEYDYEPDYDEEARNYEELRNEWEAEIRRNPQDYGIEGTTSDPEYGQYTVGGFGRKPQANYTVSAGRLIAEDRFGKGNRETPEFLKPYLTSEGLFKAEEGFDPRQGELPLDAPKLESRAFQIEALRRARRDSDPNAAAFRVDSDRSHYDALGDNQLFFSRETDRSAPDWGSVRRGIGRDPAARLALANGESLPNNVPPTSPMRLVEEAQSDWLQAGRKTGWADPKGLEKIKQEDADLVASTDVNNQRVESFRRQALDELPAALEDDRIKQFLDNQRSLVRQAEQLGTEPPYSAGRVDELINTFTERNQRNPGAYSLDERLAAAHELFRNIYNYSDAGSPAEAFARQIQHSLEALPRMQEVPRGKAASPSAPMRETRQYTQLALADALRRAVAEGQQYLAWTPGDVHTKRWGTDTLQYAAVPENPRLIRWDNAQTVKDDLGKTGLQNLQDSAEALFDNDNARTLDLDAPDIDKQLYDIVEHSLNYGMHEYRRPDVARQKRAALLKKEMEAVSKAAQAGERKAAHYSPRAVGYDLAYEPMAEDIIAILRRAGVKKLPKIHEIPNQDSPVPLRGFEIDPEVAQAVKRGLPLPY